MMNILWYIKYNRNQILLFMKITSILSFALFFGIATAYANPDPMDDVLQDLENIPDAVISQAPISSKKKKSRASKAEKAHPIYKDLRFAAMNSDHGRSLKEAFPRTHILVIFWGSFCGPCLREFPSLERLAKKIPPNVKIVSVAVDGKNEYSSELPLFYLHQGTRDQNQKFLEKYSVNGVPAFFLFNDQGDLVWNGVGAKEWDSEENVNRIWGLLKIREQHSSKKTIKKDSKHKKRRKST